jgi:hypothetical protein
MLLILIALKTDKLLLLNVTHKVSIMFILQNILPNTPKSGMMCKRNLPYTNHILLKGLGPEYAVVIQFYHTEDS